MTEKDPVTVVRAFMRDAESNPDGPASAFRAWMHPDCVWENSGLPPCNGVDACVELLERTRAELGYHTWRTEFRGIAADGNLVLTERVDHLVDAAGQDVVVYADAGTFEIIDGSIRSWRDYFEPGATVAP